MKLDKLIDVLLKAQAAVCNCHDTNPEVALCYEPGAIEDGFDWEHTEGVSDVRVTSDWPLPGESMIVHESEKPSKVIIFYNSHFALDSSKE